MNAKWDSKGKEWNFKFIRNWATFLRLRERESCFSVSDSAPKTNLQQLCVWVFLVWIIMSATTSVSNLFCGQIVNAFFLCDSFTDQWRFSFSVSVCTFSKRWALCVSKAGFVGDVGLSSRRFDLTRESKREFIKTTLSHCHLKCHWKALRGVWGENFYRCVIENKWKNLDEQTSHNYVKIYRQPLFFFN